jgi:hypothetical protein
MSATVMKVVRMVSVKGPRHCRGWHRFLDQQSAAALHAVYLVGVWRSLELMGSTDREIRFLLCSSKRLKLAMELLFE